MSDTDARTNNNGYSDQIRVLHVDDEPRVAETVAERLEHEDDRFEVLTTDDPTDGLDRIASDGVDCVVADYGIAGTEGLAFLDDVRRRRPELPFILFTAKGSEDVAGEAVAADATDYLRKTADGDAVAALAESIACAVDGRGGQSDVAGVLGHEIRTPLQVLVGALDRAEETCEPEHFERARSAVARMDRLTADLLDLADAHRETGDRTAVELGDVATASWRNVATGDAELVVATDRTVAADRGRLEELLENLFGNAVRHGGEDVTVTVGALDDGFYVEDDGRGIPEEVRDDLFDTGVSTHEEGTGLGLAIVEEIVASHGWRVTAAPTDGGARFEVRGVPET